MKRETLESEIRQVVLSSVEVDGLTEADLPSDVPLFGDGVGLDSIDALELIVLMEKNYGIKLTSPAEGKAVFQSVAVMADYVSKNRKK